MTTEQAREVRRLYVFAEMREAAIARRLGLPLADVKRYVETGTLREGKVEAFDSTPEARTTTDPLDAVIDEMMGGRR